MRLHLTYIQTDLADCCSDFIVERQGQVLDAVTARARDYSALSIIKVLHPLTGGAATFTELYRDSKIRMKKSFIAYLHLCRSYSADHKFVQNIDQHLLESITTSQKNSVFHE